MITCGRCGRQNSDQLRFCADCGTPLQASGTDRPAQPQRTLLRSDDSPRASSRPPQRPIAPDFDFAPRTETCRRCNAPNAPGTRFCPECGEPIVPPDATQMMTGPAAQPDTVICHRCRGSNAPQMAFCQYCGTKLRADAPTAPAAPQSRGPAPPRGPAEEPSARLVVIAQDGTPGAEYPLVGQQTDIGRDEGSIALSADPYVSPRHARIINRNGRFFVRDLESVNGVYVRLRGAETLRHADLVLAGLEVLRFELVSDAERGLGPASERGTRVFGSPALPRYARLCQRTVEGVTRDIFYLCKDETVIGRESGDVVFTGDPFMSRRHAAFAREPSSGTFSVRDLGSSNGTYLAVRGEHELSNGDHVRLGQHLFRLEVFGTNR
jgi:pSer/pThr/pTyr-binding forkhead associated (FHA) protein